VRGLLGLEKTVRILEPKIIPAAFPAFNTDSDMQKWLKK
jgi:hypothetical protein